MSHRLLLDRQLRLKLGGISKTTLWRLRKTDPRFPRPTKLRGQNATDDDEADRYAGILLAERDQTEPGDRGQAA